MTQERQTERLYSAIENLETPPPHVGAETAVHAAREIFGLPVDTARPLPGERDRNFLLTAGGERFVMKVVHPAEDPGVSELQARLLTHLACNGVPVQTVIKPLDGRKPRLLLPGSPTISCQVRCVTYLPGQRLADVPATSTRWRGLGHFLARVDRALADFIEPRADRPFLWDIQRVEQLRPLIEYVRDPLRRERVLAVIDEFSSDVGPRMRELDRQVIHNDANPQNVLVALNDPDRISGVIDFGDAVHGPSAQELAVAIAYQPLAGVRPFAAAAEMARGYHELRPLSERELMLLPALIATRLALTTVITAWRSALHPKNAGYIMRNDETIEVNLALVSALSGHDGVARFVASVLDPGSGPTGRT